MANGTVTANPGTGGQDFRTLSDSGGDHSTKVTVEYSDGGGTPVPVTVDPTNRLPVSGAGDVAHDSVDSGNPVKVGGVARAELPAAVASGDRSNLGTDLYGRMLAGRFPLGAVKTKHVEYTTQQTGGVHIDPTAGKRIAVTSITIGAKATTAGLVTIWFGANGDNTYDEGTDKAVEVLTLIPATDREAGFSRGYEDPPCSDTADDELKITTSAAINLDLTIHYVEF